MSDRITVIGNVATEPEQRRTGSGIPVTTFRLASSQRHRDPQSGEWVDGATNWYRVSVFRALGENAFASLRKGQRVFVDGRLRVREWESGGKRGIEIEIDADAIGPDLKWGTATFQKAARTEAPVVQHPATGAGASAGNAGRVDPADTNTDTDTDGEWSVADVPSGTLDATTPF
ncbi:single-stranded DNA-binding protein [Microbacterium arborescens]|uniref:single-stranded DNA-binding protein n=1 Tax=Microbacterium arborescens TaxID=33883 RepID=UPI003C7953CE